MSTTHTPLGPSPTPISHGSQVVTHPANAPNTNVALQDAAGAAVRIAFGMMLAGWGISSLGTVLSRMLEPQQPVRLHAFWFDLMIALALVASGTMLTTRKGTPLAWTLLIPVGIHVLFQWVLFGRSLR